MNIIVTGGASGLGSSITNKLLMEGHVVLFTYNKSAEKAKEILQKYPNASAEKCDFNDTKSVTTFLNKVSEFSPDVLINNALSSFPQKHFNKFTSQNFIDGFVNNINPIINITQQAILEFRKKKFGKIITILSSSLINKPPIGYSQYCAEKSYLFSLHKSWVSENATYNITSNCISPSFMLTDLNKEVDERIIENIINSTPLKKLLTPNEVAEAVIFFTNCTQQINGQHLTINQGTNI